MRFLNWLFPSDDGPTIRPLGPEHYTFLGHDERKASVSRAKREIAERSRRRAALIVSGAPSATVLKLVKKA